MSLPQQLCLVALTLLAASLAAVTSFPISGGLMPRTLPVLNMPDVCNGNFHCLTVELANQSYQFFKHIYCEPVGQYDHDGNFWRTIVFNGQCAGQFHLHCFDRHAGPDFNVSTQGLVEMQFGQLSDGGSRFSTTDADVVGVSSDGGLLDALRVESRELVTHSRWVDLVVWCKVW